MPDLANARTNKPLTQASLAYMNKLDDFIRFKVAPQVSVKEKAGTIYDYGKSFMRIVDTNRATYGRYNKIHLEVTKSDHYFCEDHGLFGDVYEEEVRDAEAPINAETDIAKLVLHNWMLDGEKKIADVLTDDSIITQGVTLTGNDKWNVYSHADSDPIADIQLGVDTVEDATGKTPNSIVLPKKVARTLIYHPDIKAQFPGAAKITFQMVMDALGAIFGFDNVYMPNTKYTNTNEGASSQPLSNIRGNHTLIFYQDRIPMKQSLSLAYTFMVRPGLQTTKLSKKDIGERATLEKVYSMVGQSAEYDQVLQTPTCAYLIKDCI